MEKTMDEVGGETILLWKASAKPGNGFRKRFGGYLPSAAVEPSACCCNLVGRPDDTNVDVIFPC
jgi:hypothetical protein